ncbi:cation:proton antiporter domain-containing protein [Asaia astilbis]|uniref:cation:proton antiporter domain-containing protein n=1 Tax=Asaia astilbis TaxID=610244 RepID=UPI0022B380CA|nr:cation:proton antiporter [Asaia astilbis]
MLVVGRRVIPAVLHYVAHTGSRELFRLALLALALGVAFIATEWFDVSFALGAFVAGMVLSESELSHRAAAETLPLRDAFAVLFFISVGMLFNPLVLIRQPFPLLLTVLVILVGTPLAVIIILRTLRQPWNTTLFIASGLAQIGEFSFILAALGIKMGVLDARGQDLILAPRSSPS